MHNCAVYPVSRLNLCTFLRTNFKPCKCRNNTMEHVEHNKWPEIILSAIVMLNAWASLHGQDYLWTILVSLPTLKSFFLLHPSYHNCLCSPPTRPSHYAGLKLVSTLSRKWSTWKFSNTIRSKLSQLSYGWSQLRVSSNKALWLTGL